MKNKKLALVTGATGAIGKAIARQILVSGEYHVIMVVRNEQKAIIASEEIMKRTGLDEISFAVIDLSNKKQIFDFASGLNQPLHLLVNNAADTPQRRLETNEGIEMQFAVNVLGYFWMIRAFTPHLRAGAPARVVNVASYWAGGMDLSDLEYKRRHYDNDSAYRQSKQADRMLTVAFADRLSPYKITVNACHPGDVNSALSNSMGFGGHESPDQGAATPVWLSTSHDVEGVTGKYFEHKRETTCNFCRDRNITDKLFEICANY